MPPLLLSRVNSQLTMSFLRPLWISYLRQSPDYSVSALTGSSLVDIVYHRVVLILY